MSEFNDAELIASWAKDAMMQLINAGIVSGSNGELFPTSITTRAEIAQVLHNLLSK